MPKQAELTATAYQVDKSLVIHYIG